MTSPRCFRCGLTEELERVGDGYLCPSCIPSSPDDDAKRSDLSTSGNDSGEGPASADNSSGPVGEDHVARATSEPFYSPAIRARDWWVTWILDGQERKRPVAPWQTGHAYPVEWRGDLDDDKRPETGFEEAKRWADFDLGDAGLALPDDAQSDALRVGIILPVDRPPRDDRLVLIDWDDVRDPETEEIHPVAAKYITNYGGYVEISRSGEGLHQYVFGGLRHRDRFIAPLDNEPFIGDDLPQVEIYDGGRHVAMTGYHVVGTDSNPVEAQNGIDAIIREFADAERDAGYRTTDPAEATPTDENERDGQDNNIAAPVPEPDPCEYNGPPIDELRESKPADRSLAYHAVVEAFCEGYAGVLNWRLEGAAAALGQREDRTVDEIITDLRSDERADGSVGYDRKTAGRVTYDYSRAERGEFAPASWGTLASWGVFPPEVVEDQGKGGRYEVETCKPPAHDTQVLDIDTQRATLRGKEFDDVLDDDCLALWGDEAGVGKTTNAGIAALERDVDHALLFDKHAKAREYLTDEPILDAGGEHYHHQKGAEQKRDPQCMDADHAGDDAVCPEHGHSATCPSMCPVYDLDAEHPVRRAFDALVPEVGVEQAHRILGLGDEDVHDWHPETCAWLAQYDDAKRADAVAGVHPYLTQSTVTGDDLTIIDETPALGVHDRELDRTALLRMAATLDRLAEISPDNEAVTHTAREFADFVRAIVDLSIEGERDLGVLSPPSITWNVYETYNDVAGRHLARDLPDEDWQLAEALAECKLAYGETVHSRMQRNEWEGTPLSLDPLLAAAVDAGLDVGPVRRALAAPAVLTACPRCHSTLVPHNGERACSGESGCGWSERDGALTTADSLGRATAWVATDTDDTPTGLAYRALPTVDELPDPADTLVLDATATPEKVAALFGVDVDKVDVRGDDPLDIPNLRVTQVLDGQYHANTIDSAVDEDRLLADRIQETIDTAADVHDTPLYVVKQGLRDHFDFPENGVVAHYHALRGLNVDDCDAVVCIGAPHPDIDDLQRDAEVLAMGLPNLDVGGEEHSTRPDAPNPPVYRKLHYEDDDGCGRAVPTKHYTGMVGVLFREAREKELVQAVHRIRPLLADETKHAYLLTNVPTNLAIDEVATFEELADPHQAIMPVSEGAVELLGAVCDVVADDGLDGFRAGSLVEQRDGDSVANKVAGYYRMARIVGLDVTLRTVYDWVQDLEGLGLLHPEEYEQRAGVSYVADLATLNSALSVLSDNGGLKVTAKRRLRALATEGESAADWLPWAHRAFAVEVGRQGDGPPPDGFIDPF